MRRSPAACRIWIRFGAYLDQSEILEFGQAAADGFAAHTEDKRQCRRGHVELELAAALAANLQPSGDVQQESRHALCCPQ